MPASKPLAKYLVFLRGVNVGGHLVKMAELKKVLEALGFQNIKTFLASGNVAFEAAETDTKVLTGKIEKELEKKFGFGILIVIRTHKDIEKLVAMDPFRGIVVDKNTRRYVTFLKEKKASALKIPYSSVGGGFRILKVTEHEIFSVLQLNEERRTVDLMAIVEKEFGNKVTTRNWNTVKKML